VNPRPSRAAPPRWLITLCLLVAAAIWLRSRPLEPPPGAPGDRPAISPAPRPAEPATATASDADASVIVRQVTIRDLSGRMVFQGDVNLAPTLARIERGERRPHRNDGGVFRNLEGRLPKQPAGYYREYVHPTPKLDGPGPQRLVLGREGEVYYTPDHYRTFQQIR
jgi:filamentous hemagglutinin